MIITLLCFDGTYHPYKKVSKIFSSILKSHEFAEGIRFHIEKEKMMLTMISVMLTKLASLKLYNSQD